MRGKNIIIILLAVIFTLGISGAGEAKKRCDLIVKSLSAPSSTETGLKIRIVSSVKNKGTSEAKKSYTLFYLSKNSTFGSSDIYLGRVKVSSLKEGETSKKYKKYVNIPDEVTEGRYYIIARADGYKKVKENSEKNNYKKDKITINAAEFVMTRDGFDYDVDGNFEETLDFTYTSKGKRTKAEADWDANGIINVTIYFDENGNVIKEIADYNEDGIIDWTEARSLTYDARGNKIKEEFDYDDDGSIDWVETFTNYYDVGGNIISEECDWGDDGSIDDFFSHTYYHDDKGMLIKEDHDDNPDWIPFSNEEVFSGPRTYHFNEKGMRIKVELDWDDDGIINRIHYYDVRGNTTKVEVDWGDDGSIDQVDTYTNTYDARGNKTKVEFDWGSDGIDEVRTFNYDIYGNMVREESDYDMDGNADFRRTCTWKRL